MLLAFALLRILSQVGGPTSWLGIYELMGRCDNVVRDGPNMRSPQCAQSCFEAAGESCPLTRNRQHHYSFTCDGESIAVNFSESDDLEALSKSITQGFLGGGVGGAASTLEAELRAVLADDLKVDAALEEADRANWEMVASIPPSPYVAKGRVMGRTFCRHGANTGLPSDHYDFLLSSHNLEVLEL